MWVMIDLIEANVLGGVDDGTVADSVGDIMLEELAVLENLSDKVLHFPDDVHNWLMIIPKTCKTNVYVRVRIDSWG